MSLFARITEGVMGRGLLTLRPLLRRRTNAQLIDLLPGLPSAVLGELVKLQPLPGRDSIYFLLNFLRYQDRWAVSDERIAERVRRHLVHPVLASERARARALRAHGFRGLGSIILTPTVACNLRCEHCYNLYELHDHGAAQLSLETMRRLLDEAKQLGAYRASFIGGEPLIRARDLVALAREHADVLLTIFTNGTLLTDELAAEMAEAGNIELAFSIDGSEAQHDRWRGAGSFRATLDALRRYHRAGGLALFSPTVTSENYRTVLGDEYLSLMAESGAYMGYLHHYDLVGGQARADWLLDPEQLSWMKQRIEEIHRAGTVSVLSNVVSDLVRGGCPAVRDFVHVNHRGEVEPCCMVPVAVASQSVHQRSLVEILASPFLSRLRKIGKDDSGIQRCLMSENAPILAEAVAAGEATATTRQARESLARLATDGDPRRENMPTCFAGTAARS